MISVVHPETLMSVVDLLHLFSHALVVVTRRTIPASFIAPDAGRSSLYDRSPDDVCDDGVRLLSSLSFVHLAPL
jgi:hypothetical protein